MQGIVEDVTTRIKCDKIKWREFTRMLCDKKVPLKIKAKFCKTGV